MKDYKAIYLKYFFFWQEAYEKLYQENKQLLAEIEKLKKLVK